MKKLKLSLATLLTIFSLAGGILLPTATQVAAADTDTTVGLKDVKEETCKHTGTPEYEGGKFNGCKDVKNGVVGTIQRIINILLFILGIIAAIVIVVAGIMYATSGGNTEQTNKAKNAILYAVIGIIVAVMAYAIVGFVVQNIK